MMGVMAARIERRDPNERARAKAASRAADERSLLSGEKSPAQVKRENEFLAPLVSSARIDLSASRSLS
jgi:hypothetical protein